MSSNRWRLWEVEAPSSEFAARTVAAILRDRRRRGASGRRWATIGVLAAALITGGAWGFTRFSRVTTCVAAAARPTTVPAQAATQRAAVEQPIAPTVEPIEAPPAISSPRRRDHAPV